MPAQIFNEILRQASYKGLVRGAILYTDSTHVKAKANRHKKRAVTRHVWQDDLDKANAFTKTPNGKRLYRWRKETIERSFPKAKELHGLRYARMLGLAGMYG